ncbi:MAG TPA: alpha/beta hydrolase [Acidimicrobiales bacterium]
MTPIVADVRGHGPPVVLLHGQPGSAADWGPLRRLLEDDYTVIVPDRPGYGRTGGTALGFRGNADAIADLLDRYGISSATIVGHSWGGGVAIALAEGHPGRVAGLVLVSSIGPGDPLSRLDRLLAIPPVGTAIAAVVLNAAGLVLSLAAVRRYIDRRVRGTNDESLAAMADAWRAGKVWRSYVIEQRALVYELPGLAPGMAWIQAPTAVLIGGADHVVPPASGERLAASIPGARLTCLAGVGHLLAHEQPEVVAAAVVEVMGRESA